TPSFHGEKRGGHASALAEQDVMRTNRGSGREGFGPEPPLAQRRDEVRSEQRHGPPGPNEEDVDLRGFRHDTLESGNVEIVRRGGRPGPDPARQRQDRTPVRHTGEAESAAAIGLDRRPTGKVTFPP